MHLILKKEKICEIIRFLFLFTVFISYVFSAIYKILGINTQNLQTVINIFYLIIFLIYLLLKFRIRLLPFLIAIALIMLTLFSCLVNNGLFNDYLNDILVFLMISLPCLIMFFDDINEDSYKTLYFLCIISGTFFSIIFIIQSFVFEILNNFDYQSVSYALIIPILFLIKNKKNVYEFFLLVIMLFFAIFMGGRGPLICILLYFIYCFISSKKTSYILKLIVILLTIILIVLYKPIISLIVEISGKLGLKGSFATYFSYGDILSDSGRLDIYKYSLEKANYNWLFGTGIFSDRLLLSQIDRSYPHNIFVEAIMQFGYPVSIVACSVLIFNFFRYMFKKDDEVYSKVIMEELFFSTGFLILVFSSSYLLQPAFFALVGILLNSDSRRKKNEKSVIEL